MLRIIGNKEFLEIFENFQVDRRLKQKIGEVEEAGSNGIITSNNAGSFISFGDSGTGTDTGTIRLSSTSNNIMSWSADSSIIIDSPVDSFLREVDGLLTRIIRVFNRNYKKKAISKIGTSKSIREFFTSFSNEVKELRPLAEIATAYESAFLQAEELGQDSLKEKLENRIEVSRTEAHLIQAGYKKYITEEQVIKFYRKVKRDKNIKLSWMKNFTRIIPTSIVMMMKEINERQVFDNYVILHYDPKDEGDEMTQKEKERKKDPILFGVINKSRRLYYVADWKDEVCDLTLDDLLSTLKERAGTINNNSVKSAITVE